MAYRPLEKLINLHDGYRRAFRTEQGEVLLIQEEGKVSLIGRICPHQDAPLDHAPVNGDCITCPLHQLRFSLVSGEQLNGRYLKLPVYPIAYEGNTLGIDE